MLDAAYRLLQESSIEDVTVQSLAAEAGVSSATIYRWWSSKEAVLMEGFLEAIGTRQAADDPQESPLERLRGGVLGLARFLVGPDGLLLKRLSAAVQDRPNLQQLLERRFFSPRRDQAQTCIAHAVSAGQLRADVDPDALFDTLVGPLYYRAFVAHAPADERVAGMIFDDVMTGARGVGSPARRAIGD